MKTHYKFFLVVLSCILLQGIAYADKATKKQSLGLPRFASLKTGEVNLRTGPGDGHPIDYVLKWKGMPVKIIEEFDTWRKIIDAKDTQGWVHQNTLSGKKSIQVVSNDCNLFKQPNPSSGVIAEVQLDSIGYIKKIQDKWCQVDFAGKKGWILKEKVWGF